MALQSPNIPCDVGVGLKPAHYADILESTPDIGWFEIHPENYMGAGGPPHAYLQRVRERYPLSVHGVGLSIGGASPLDDAHLDRLKAVVDRYQPGLVSEHLAWSGHGMRFFNDLLPVPYTDETLNLVCDHVDQVQSYLGRRILIENPSVYVAFGNNEMPETDFLAALATRTGCGLLLDVNNVFVSCTNRQQAPYAYLESFPFAHVEEVHLAGHTRDDETTRHSLLIDSHDQPVASPVWDLYAHAVSLAGPVPTLIERDDNIPPWADLFQEALQARAILWDTAPEARHVG